MKIKLKHAIAHQGKIKFPGEIVDLTYSRAICLSHGEEVKENKPFVEEEVKPKPSKRNKPTEVTPDDFGNIT